jgi:hypothetical protein
VPSRLSGTQMGVETRESTPNAHEQMRAIPAIVLLIRIIDK